MTSLAIADALQNGPRYDACCPARAALGTGGSAAGRKRHEARGVRATVPSRRHEARSSDPAFNRTPAARRRKASDPVGRRCRRRHRRGTLAPARTGFLRALALQE